MFTNWKMVTLEKNKSDYQTLLRRLKKQCLKFKYVLAELKS